MLAANTFASQLRKQALLGQVTRVHAEMFGSLGTTGKGHGTPKAVLMGLEGERPESVDTTTIAERVATIKTDKTLSLLGERPITFDYDHDLTLHRRKSLPFHPNGMQFSAYDNAQNIILQRTYYSVGGGFVVDDEASLGATIAELDTSVPYPFSSANELLAICQQHQLSIAEVMWQNELSQRTEQEIKDGLMNIWSVMQQCVNSGTQQEGILPGGLKVKRRAAALKQQLLNRPEAGLSDPLTTLDWVTLYALAVNEENAGGGRIVTAPTNGAAGIIPAVLMYYMNFVPKAREQDVITFLLTASAIGILFKLNASISGAEVGCQGEVGSACSMAAGGLAAVLGASPAQVENAAEIAMEHNLGLTCDPIGGLVQVPCIERNAMASVKAIHAARMALRGDGSHFVSLDKVIRTMRKTGEDMNNRYKETARGGLAIHVLDVPVNIVEC